MRLEDCPVRAAPDIMGGKWKPVVIPLPDGWHEALWRIAPLPADTTQKMLTQQLRELERDGIVARKVYHQVPPKVEYSLTTYSKTLRPVMLELCKWGKTRTAKFSRKAWTAGRR